MLFLHPINLQKLESMRNQQIKNKTIIIANYKGIDVLLDGNHRVAATLLQNHLKNPEQIKNVLEFTYIQCYLKDYEHFEKRLATLLNEYYKQFKVKKFIRSDTGETIELDKIKDVWWDFLIEESENREKYVSYLDMVTIVDEFVTIPIEAEINYLLLRKIIDSVREVKYAIDLQKNGKKLSFSEFKEYMERVLEMKGEFILQICPYMNYTYPDEYFVYKDGILYWTGGGCYEGIMKEWKIDNGQIERYLYETYQNLLNRGEKLFYDISGIYID